MKRALVSQNRRSPHMYIISLLGRRAGPQLPSPTSFNDIFSSCVDPPEQSLFDLLLILHLNLFFFHFHCHHPAIIPRTDD
jgi:hypothetical protein